MKRMDRLSLAGIAFALCFSLVAGLAGIAVSKEKEKAEDSARKYGLGQVVAERLLDAYGLLEEEKYDEALAIIDGLAKRRRLKDPERAQIHRFRAYIHVSREQNDLAIAEFEKSLALHAMEPAAEQVMLYSMAQIYTGEGQFDRALDVIDRWFAAEENPKADAWFLKAMILVQQEKFAEAAAPVSRAIELSPQPKESWLTLYGVVFSQLKDYAKVEVALERLVELAPGKPQYWVQLAAVQHHLGQDDEALATMQIARQAGLIQGDKEIRQLASLLFLRQQPFECAKVMEQSMAAGQVQADAEAYRLLSSCFVAARESEKALAPLAKGGELAADGDMYVMLGQMYLQREEHGPAIEALENALAKARPEQRGSIHLMLGIAKLGDEQLDAAEQSFKMAVDDAKAGRAAESYLKFLESKRSLAAQPRLASSATGG
ncbi:MAG: tetratricopeptide repeat protein [Deltaproteobacteria bacterium]|nr:tetratricopeptide repeat protein [Deltaproteobacteria bacterium]